MERKRLKDEDLKGITDEATEGEGDVVSTLRLFSSGSTLLDCVLGGGWVCGRVGNIVGDKSTGKTLLAIEASANFAASFDDDSPIKYSEAESAFDIPYAEKLGLPKSRVDFGNTPLETAEGFFKDLQAFTDKVPKKKQGLYILDSLDALSDEAEMVRDTDKGSFGMGKAKMMSQLFRRMIRKLEEKHVCLLIISQVRDNIGVTFGRQTVRTGGRALDFYASQVLYLAQVGKIEKTRHKITRPTGVNIRAKCDKNKIGPPFRECDFPILFNYGIDDIAANLYWLEKVGRLNEVMKGSKDDIPEYLKALNKLDMDDYNNTKEDLAVVVKKIWREVEKDFLPKRRKYL